MGHLVLLLGLALPLMGWVLSPKLRLGDPVATVVGDSLQISVVIAGDELADLDSISAEMCSPPRTANCVFAGDPGFPALVGPFATPPTAQLTILGPDPGVTITGNFCVRPWKTGTDGISRRGPRTCSLEWSHIGSQPPAPVDTLPPGALSFPNAPIVVVIAGDSVPQDSTPPDTTTPPPPTGSYDPEPPRIFINTDTRPAELRVVDVAVGGLQAAIDAAQCGDALVLQAGARYIGNFRLRVRKCRVAPITIRSSIAAQPKGNRVHLDDTTRTAHLVSVTSASVISTEDGTEGWYLLDLYTPNESAIVASIGRSQTWSVIDLVGGGGFTSDTLVLPGFITLEHIIVLGKDDQQLRRCVTLAGRYLAVIDSYLAGCHDYADAQAIGGWGGLGPYKIANNYLESSGENFMNGGTKVPRDTLHTAADIEIVENHFRKPPEWSRDHPNFTPVPGTCSGTRACAWPIKNLFEIKTGKRYYVARNLFENNWASAQAGTGILWQAVDGTHALIRDVMFRYNIIASTPGLIALCTTADYPGTKGMPPPCERLAVMNNLLVGILDPGGNLGASRGFQLSGPTKGTRVEHNTAVWPGMQGYNYMVFHGTNRAGTNVVNNVFCQTKYGLTGDGTGGQGALDKHDPTANVKGNVIFDATQPQNAATRVAGNTYIPTDCPQTDVASVLAGDVPDASAFLGTDGLTPGVDVTRLPDIAKVRSGR